MAVLGKKLIDPNNCTTVRELAVALDQLAKALGYPAPDPGPGPDGTTPPSIPIDLTGGVVVTYIIRALVNQVGGVPATQTTFAFDGATDLYGTSGVVAGTAQNIAGRYFQDNEPVNLTSFNGTIWFADKLADNVIAAFVDQAGGVITTDAEFAFDGAVSVTGAIPPGGTGTVVNFPAHAYSDNEQIVLNLIEQGPNAGKWIVVQDDDDLGGGGGGESLTADFCIDATKLTTENKIALIDTGYEGLEWEFFGAFNDVKGWSTPIDYETGNVQLIGKTSGNVLKWFTAIECNPSP